MILGAGVGVAAAAAVLALAGPATTDRASGIAVSGTVRTGPTGTGIPGLTIELVGETGARYAARTGPDGTYLVRAPAGRYLVRVVDDDRGVVAAVEPGLLNPEITLRRDGVLDLETGRFGHEGGDHPGTPSPVPGPIG